METGKNHSILIRLAVTCILSGISYLASALTWGYDTYIGNGTSGYALTGLSFQPDLIIIKGTGATPAYIRTTGDAANESKEMDVAGAYAADAILSFSASGFTLGTNAGVNSNGATYDFVAFQAGTDMVVGSYTGGGGFSQSVTGLGFTPAFLIIYSNSTSEVPVYTTTQMVSTGAAEFGSEQVWMNYINSLDANGFTLGSYLNTSGQVFHYAAFKAVPGTLVTGSYSGSSSTQAIATAGLSPQYVLATNGSVFGVPTQKILVNAPTESMPFVNKASTTTDIIGLNAASFSVDGGSGNVNSTLNTNFYIAIGNGIASALPVEWLYFHASCQSGKVQLNWATATETDCQYFSMEAGTNGTDFTTIGKIYGGGNSATQLDYSFTDPVVHHTTQYYRIRETDFNGKSICSKVIAVEPCTPPASLQLSVYPNPAAGNCMSTLSLEEETSVEIQVFHSTGQEMYAQQLACTKGENKIGIPSGEWVKGIYFLVVNVNGVISKLKIVKP
ncbi:MAG TPA: T9SS type A sorting domain-containing protein [Bacteroidia bacterium]|jgi:hypothetical protein|nr:T9SS type A sorting domain-containing protein [Bacteroidia bacterium]